MIFEFQTHVARITAMPVANASLYDGATALAEASLMSAKITRAYIPAPRTNARNRGIGLDKLVRQTRTQPLDIVQPTADEALGGRNRAQGVLGGGGLRLLSDDHRIPGETHHGRKQMEAADVRQGIRGAAADRGDEGVGRSQVDPRRQAVLMGCCGVSRLRNL